MRSVLVAGASGALGRLIVRSLKEKGFRVRALSRQPINSAADETLVADMTQPRSIADCCKGIDTVVSCAGCGEKETGRLFPFIAVIEHCTAPTDTTS